MYMRAVTNLQGPPERDVAAGLALRPVRALPVSLHAEGRVSVRSTGTSIRPAVFLAGGVDAKPIGKTGVLVRGYAQAGYVGEPDATAFADGSLIVERPLISGGAVTLAGGTGAWGGAQAGAARLDIGPSVAMRLPLAGKTALIEAQYRFRVAGNAEPKDHPAITLALGF